MMNEYIAETIFRTGHSVGPDSSAVISSDPCATPRDAIRNVGLGRWLRNRKIILGEYYQIGERTSLRVYETRKPETNAETAAKLETRIAAAEVILAPYRTDMQREWAEMDRGEWTEASCGIADKLCRAYCYATTGFANYRTRSESHVWYWLAREAREALRIADDSDDARRWCAHKVAAIEFAAEVAKEVAKT